MSSLLSKIWQDSLLVRPVLVAVFLSILLFTVTQAMPDRQFLIFDIEKPSNGLRLLYYDRMWGGESSGAWDKDDKDLAVCTIRKSDIEPGCGFAFKFPKKKLAKFSNQLYAEYLTAFDFSKYDEILIDFEYHGSGENLQVYIRNNENRFKTVDEEKVLNYVVSTKSQSEQLVIPIKELKVADWWFVKHKINAEKERTVLDSIVAIGFDVLGPAVPSVHKIKIKSISLNKKAPGLMVITPYLLLIWLVTVLYLIVAHVMFFMRNYNENTRLLSELSIKYDNLKQTSLLIEDVVESVAKGNLEKRVPMNTVPPDLRGMVSEINSALEYLDASLQKQKMLAANASHELRTPVAALLAETESILRKERSGEEYFLSLKCCNQLANRLKVLVEHLTVLSKLSKGYDSFQREEVNIREVVKSSLITIKPLAEQKNIEVSSLLEHGCCMVNRELFTQAISCVIFNAVQYNKANGSIAVIMKKQMPFMLIEVTDTGVGVSEEEQEKVFDRYYRGAEATSMVETSSGLGLSITKEVLEKIGGEVIFSSEKGVGTTVSLKVPLSSVG